MFLNDHLLTSALPVRGPFRKTDDYHVFHVGDPGWKALTMSGITWGNRR